MNKAFVDRYWPGQNAIGKSVEFYGRPLTVVGVAANAKYRRLTDDPSPLILLPLMQDSPEPGDPDVRTRGNPWHLHRRLKMRFTALTPICRCST